MLNVPAREAMISPRNMAGDDAVVSTIVPSAAIEGLLVFKLISISTNVRGIQSFPRMVIVEPAVPTEGAICKTGP